MLLFEITVDSLKKKMCIGVIVVAAFVIFERETEDCLLESFPGLFPDLVGLVHGSGDACISEEKKKEEV